MIIVEEIILISIDRAQHKLLGGGGGDLYDGLPPKVLLINFKGSHHQHFISKISLSPILSSSLYFNRNYHEKNKDNPSQTRGRDGWCNCTWTNFHCILCLGVCIFFIFWIFLLLRYAAAVREVFKRDLLKKVGLLDQPTRLPPCPPSNYEQSSFLFPKRAFFWSWVRPGQFPQTTCS